MGVRTLIIAGFLAAAGLAGGQASAGPVPLMAEPVAKAMAEEISGEAAKRNLEFLALQHRMRGSRDFHRAARFIEDKLTEYGLEEVEILQFPADGKTMYGTQKARPAWDAEFAELWLLEQDGGDWRPKTRLASYHAMPLVLAQDSESADVAADLVDVGDGTSESDYEGRDVRGKLVLAAAQPGPVARFAVERFGAVGIVSYAQNQRTAWWKEDENLIRWGHLDSFTATRTFAFMVSLKQARAFRERLDKGERVRLHAIVRAGRHEGFYDVVTAAIPGADPELRHQDIAFSCHLDHPRPGANDNVSGCVAILEVARAMAKLIAEDRIPRPRRTLRFYWPAEIEGTMALLNARPDLAARIKTVVHMDMVGGGPATKAIFRVSRTPASLPSFTGDVAEALGRFVNDQSEKFASGEDPGFPLAAPEGGKEALGAILGRFSMGSDHQVYADSSFSIPFIYLHDWPDRYIHTNFDVAANIDPTKLKRAAFIGAASAYVLANLEASDADELWRLVRVQGLRRMADMMERRAGLEPVEALNLTRRHFALERAIAASIENFVTVPGSTRAEAESFLATLEDMIAAGAVPDATAPGHDLVYRRQSQPKGPMRVFGYNYFEDHLGRERTREIGLPQYRGLWGGGGEYAYEALNFVDGRRTAADIRDALAAEFGPVPLRLVTQYLAALEEIGVLARVEK